MARVKLRHIPYRGSAPALQGLVAGDVDLMFDNLGVSLALVEGGKLKLLAVASPRRLPSSASDSISTSSPSAMPLACMSA